MRLQIRTETYHKPELRSGMRLLLARLEGGGSSRSFLISLTLIGEYLTSLIGHKAVVFPCFSPAVELKIEATARFS